MNDQRPKDPDARDLASIKARYAGCPLNDEELAAWALKQYAKEGRPEPKPAFGETIEDARRRRWWLYDYNQRYSRGEIKVI